MIKIDDASSSFWAATRNPETRNGLGVLERERLKSWLHGAYQAIESCAITVGHAALRGINQRVVSGVGHTISRAVGCRPM